MLKKRIIPVLLLRKGRLIKPIQFDRYRDVGDPVSQAKIYDAQMADELIFLDIDATSENRNSLYGIIERVSKECFMPLTIGGGIRTIDDISRLLLAGADKVSINAAAIEDPFLITRAAEKFGSQCIIVSIDVKKTGSGYKIFTHNGKKDTGKEPVKFAKEAESLGAGEILLTSIDLEGTMKGYDMELITAVSEAVNIPVIANGGAGTLQDFKDALTIGGASAVAAGSIFHFTDQSLIKARRFLKVHDVEVRNG
jgi:imidazole glycerol-phosphate synthase subunit HisF